MFISLDLETTGVDSKKDSIIEFGAIKFDLKGKKETFQTLINPKITIPPIITHITNIQNKDVLDAPTFQEKKDEIQNFIEDLPIIGHNIKFDTGFLKENDIKILGPEYDTCSLASILLPSLPSYSLEVLSQILNLKHQEKHRALDDAIAAQELFLKLTSHFQALSKEQIQEIHQLCNKSDTPIAKLLLSLNVNKKAKQLTINSPKRNIEKEAQPKELYSIDKSFFFEKAPPFHGLVKDFESTAHKDSYLAIPAQLFNECLPHLNNTAALVDAPKKYLSIKRLEKLTKSESIPSPLFTGLLKVFIWSKITKTGLLNEITLFGEERSIISKICIDNNFTEPENDQFFQKALKKDKSKPSICTHDFLIDQTPAAKNLIILDIDNFLRTLFIKKSSFITQKFGEEILSSIATASSQKITDPLLSKLELLFGLCEAFFEIHNDKNFFRAKAHLSPLLLTDTKWQRATEVVRTLIKSSHELAQINNSKTFGLLQSWKDYLASLQEIFLNPDLNNNLIYFELFNDNITLRKNPFTLAPYIKEILDNSQNYKLVNQFIDLDDNGAFFKTILGIEQEMEIEKSPSLQKNLNILIANDKTNNETILHENFLKDFLSAKKGGSAVIFNSKAQLSHFTSFLSEHLKSQSLNLISQTTASLGKINHNCLINPDKNILFLTPNFWNNFKHKELIKTLIIQKIPFDPPSEPFLNAISKNFEDPFNDFQVKRAIFSLKKIINNLTHNKNSTITTIILDTRISNKSYGKSFLKALETLATTKIINLASILKQCQEQ